MRKPLFCVAAGILLAAAPPATHEAGVDPLTARVNASDAQRFAAMWRATGGKPTAAQIQSDYLAKGSRAIGVFTPNRIVSPENLAAKIAANRGLYDQAVERCLPWVEGTNTQLRSSYLGLRGLLPNRPLPGIAVVVGANNSGGTAARGIQVIGLEVICRLAPTRTQFEDQMRQFFTHETVHTLQPQEPEHIPDVMLYGALREGVADYVTELVTGRVPGAERNEWASAREAWVWREFMADAATVRSGTDRQGNLTPAAKSAVKRWFHNAGAPPTGWPSELGYWVGMRIAEAYLARARDPHAAIDVLINAKDPAAIVKASGYGRYL